MILLLDNYDSFVYNLARYLEELGEVVQVIRNDSITPAEVQTLAPSHLVVSPGPCTPAEAGASNSIIREVAGEIPVLGVCLGHQCLGEVFGAQVVRGNPVHHRAAVRRKQVIDRRIESAIAAIPSGQVSAANASSAR